MSYEVRNHYLFKDGRRVSYKESPNYGGTIEPELIVVHYTGDNGTGGFQWLVSSGSQVSAHLWIAKTGVVWQLLPFNVRAWHAGKSEYDNKSDVNSWSIGIELQGTGDDFPNSQMESLIGVLIALHKAYQIKGIAGHNEVCLPIGRKSDPGPNFDWDLVYKKLEDSGIKYE